MVDSSSRRDSAKDYYPSVAELVDRETEWVERVMTNLTKEGLKCLLRETVSQLKQARQVSDTIQTLSDAVKSVSTIVDQIKHSPKTETPLPTPSTSNVSNLPDQQVIKQYIVITGISEQTGTGRESRMDQERNKVVDVLNKLNCDRSEFSDIFRRGKYKSDSARPRPIVVRLQNYWDVRKILASSYKLRDTGIYVKQDQSFEDYTREKQLLKLRHDLSLIPETEFKKSDIKLRNGTLYYKNIKINDSLPLQEIAQGISA